MRYKVVNRTIRASFFKNAEEKIEAKIQNYLDQGTAAGWDLHSLTYTDSSHGINLVLIWQNDK